MLKIDNTAAVAYINNQGEIVSKELVCLTRKHWMWCLEMNIHIQAQNLPGVMNLTADAESKIMRDWSDWKLDQQVFLMIKNVYEPLEVDLFASRLTKQCHCFFSWWLDSLAEATDAFCQNWMGMKAYANPLGTYYPVYWRKHKHREQT